MPNFVGDYAGENILRDAVLVDSVTPFVTYTPSLAYQYGLSVQLITEAAPTRAVTHNAADAVVAGTGTWHFVNGAFNSGDVGATMTISGAANSGNNGAKTILTVVDSTHVTTATTSLVNETFGSGVTMSLSAFVALHGAWTVFASNDYVPPVGMGVPALNQVSYAGHWSPVANDDFSPPIEDVTAASSQFVQLDPFDGQYLKFVFTQTSGAGLVTITFAAKGHR